MWIGGRCRFEKVDAVKVPRLQFRLRGLLCAMFWASVAFAAWTLDYKPADQNLPLMFTIMAVRFLSPFVAVGALVGRSLYGLLIGILIIGGYAIWFAIAVNIGWLRFDP